MGTDFSIKANESNAQNSGHVVPAPWGFFLLDEKHPDIMIPILAWRIGDSKCNCVLPVTCIGTHSSRTYVLCPDGKVRWNALSSYSFAAWQEAEWNFKAMTEPHPMAELNLSNVPF